MATWAASLFEQGVISGSVWDFEKIFTIEAGATRSFSVQSGAIAPIIFSLLINTDITDALLQGYEDESPTGGTILTPQKYNRNSSEDPLSIVTDNVTFTPTTTPFKEAAFFGSRFSVSTYGGQVGTLIKKNTTTVYSLTNNDSGTRNCYVELVLGESVIF